jgi:branched-subunit amino acid ABC-type transport system permease component
VHYVQLILAGIFAGSVYAIGGTGIVLTYKATGVFNLAHFTIGLFAAYMLWQMNGVWGLPLWIAAPFVLIVVGPGIGVLLERFVSVRCSDDERARRRSWLRTLACSCCSSVS